MYGLLCRVVPASLAQWLVALAYAVLVLLIFFASFEPVSEFRYARM